MNWRRFNAPAPDGACSGFIVEGGLVAWSADGADFRSRFSGSGPAAVCGVPELEGLVPNLSSSA